MVLIGYSDGPVFASIPHVSIFFSLSLSLSLSSYCRNAGTEKVSTVMWLWWYLAFFILFFLYIYVLSFHCNCFAMAQMFLILWIKRKGLMFYCFV